ncbi:MAG: thiol:disulfide interchange protein DsbA/DsbL [Pseudoxanthomonas sp.]|nr:thiol:disulfide interchange protein DsbA/DsbL [Pseudoxanthomonas sp.]
MKALLTGLLLATLAWLPATPAAAQAATPTTPQAGRDYVEIPGGQPWAAKPGRVEVAEVFGYSCPHCAHLEPMLKPWKAKLPREADFVAVPAAFGGPWDSWARAYFAASNLGLLGRTHEAVFQAIHEKGTLPRNPTPQELATFYAGYGVSAESFLAAMADPRVDAQVRQAATVARAWGLEGTPTVVVAGRYRVLGNDFEDMLRITDWLVARELKAKP